ncbi:MAG: zinc-ribbon domain containing protein [Planctomycetes bacterium]|nr:zinc-ribbon domain containing protein [Planctomycetota bacterium]MCK5577931.1 zinc-ribbon domain containing protein [Planctomycetota bacterium]
MAFEDKTLKCVDCGEDFVFTVDEQTFHQEKGYTNEPKRCLKCRQGRRNKYRERQQTEVVCADCGKNTTVPFKPTRNKPVYCDECFAKNKQTEPQI